MKFKTRRKRTPPYFSREPKTGKLSIIFAIIPILFAIHWSPKWSPALKKVVTFFTDINYCCKAH
ncbi:hypothetical protein [Butyricimonas virosa]|uniref:Uncharacterized protein n=1 Tax=Butyricimonas virosa TaxID=544645 RepID=A0A415QAA5_9BACT|nr:hypothetical protein [Butyricimonas virosa]RHM38664.1 hypothetical protein DWZ68_17530 [Butyricimonas virosa]